MLLRGFESSCFSVSDLAVAVAAWAKDEADAGAGAEATAAWEAERLRSPGGAAAAAAGAPLAADVAARGAELALSRPGGGGGALRLRLLADHAPPLAPPALWFDEAALAALRMPFLTLANIKGGRSYECDECGERFERPNPLKLHLFLDCEQFEPRRFWARALPRLAAPPPPAAMPAPLVVQPRPLLFAGLGALAPARFDTLLPARLDALSPPRREALSPARLEALSPGRLEALAAEWGRGRGGHACLYCGKLYSRKYGLKIHIRTHTGYKPLRCRYCARAFGDPSNLNKHVRLHEGAASTTGDSPGGLACSRCGQRLARRRDLLRHLRARHALCAP